MDARPARVPRDDKPARVPRDDKPLRAPREEPSARSSRVDDHAEAAASRPPRRFGRPPAAPKPPAPKPPVDGGWLYGTHAILAALANPARRLAKLYVTEIPEADLAAACKKAGVEPAVVARPTLDRWLDGAAAHQGVAALAHPLPERDLASLIDTPGPAVALLLDQVTDARNVGAILRSAAAFGAAGLVLQTRFAPDPFGALAKAASGAVECVPIHREVNLTRTVEALREGGWTVVGLTGEGEDTLTGALATLPADARVCVALGAEDSGLRAKLRQSCDRRARIPMTPAMPSLNVSVAAAIALYAWTSRLG